MKKDAYYFPHFCNARSDRKIKRLKKDLGIEGYGIYFMTLEVLREQTDFKYPMSDVDLLADEFGTSEAKLQAVINSYELFNVDLDNNFFSPKLMLYLQPYIEKSERARVAAQIRWNKVKNDTNASTNANANAYANALPEHCESESKCNASKGKERREKEKSDTDTFFNELWILYPNKIGKNKVSKTQREKLLKIGIEEMTRATERYIKGKEDWKAWQQGSTFFNTSYEDYLDGNYQEVKNVSKSKGPKRWEEVEVGEQYLNPNTNMLMTKTAPIPRNN